MSAQNDSPASIHVEPMHKSSQAAIVVPPQAPLGDTTNGLLNAAPGTGAKALLARKLAKNSNPKYISPTDNFMTPCTQKISNVKKKHFMKGITPMPQLQLQSSEETVEIQDASKEDDKQIESKDLVPSSMLDDDENPF